MNGSVSNISYLSDQRKKLTEIEKHLPEPKKVGFNFVSICTSRDCVSEGTQNLVLELEFSAEAQSHGIDSILTVQTKVPKDFNLLKVSLEGRVGKAYCEG
jgi:hypothetical protein